MQKEKTESIIYIKFFLIIVLTAALISVSYKIFLAIANNSFKYRTFNVLFLDKDAYLVHLDTKDKKLGIFKFPGKRNLFLGSSNLYLSLLLGVPVDGLIIAKNPSEFAGLEKNFFPIKKAVRIIISTDSFENKNINQFDLLKIYLYSVFVPGNDRVVQEIKDIKSNFKENNQLKDFGNLFQDNDIFNEKISAEVINSTGIDGVGARVSDILKSVGFKVISVETGDDKESIIIDQVRSRNVSVPRLKSAFNIETREINETGTADITVILAKDILKSVKSF